MGPMLGDDHRGFGDLGVLVSGRLGIAGRGFLGRRGVAGGATLGEVIDDGVDPFRGQVTAEVARMAGLSAPPALGPGLDDRPGVPGGLAEGGIEQSEAF